MSTSKSKSSKNSSTNSWQIQSIIKAHDSDIRCVSFIPNTNLIITGSRDKNCHIYDPLSSKLLAILKGHTHYIQTIHVDDEFIYTGSTDQFLRKYELLPLLDQMIGDNAAAEIVTAEPAHKLNDHTEAIVSIDSSDRFIATGSWDKTCKIWKKNSDKSSLSLTGHEAAVWDCKIVKNDYVLTACADKIIRLFGLKQKGQKLVEYNGHTDCVRSLLVFDKNLDSCQDFYSTGNDGKIMLWNLETGENLDSVQAHANYCYSISGRSSDKTTFSCGEDASLLVYNPNFAENPTKNFELPCLSVWACASNQKNLSAAGTNRGELFIFTDDSSIALPSAQADLETCFTTFQNEKEAQKKAKQENQQNGLSEAELAKIPGPEILEKPGPKNDFIQMVRPSKNSKQVDVHQWNENQNKWILIGQAMGSADNQESKKLFDEDGKYYDRIFDVNADTRHGITMKLPYNYDQNPWEAAQKFIEKHGLDIEELEVVVNFIQENIPEDKRKIYLDKPTEETKPSDDDNMEVSKPFRYLPETQNILYDQIPPMDKIISKIKQFFGENISDQDIASINKFQTLLKLLSDRNLTNSVESKNIFPLLDLLRISIAQISDINASETASSIAFIQKDVLDQFAFGSSAINSTLCLKICNNLVVKLAEYRNDKNFVKSYLELVTTHLHEGQEKNLTVAITLLLNLVVNFNDFKEDSIFISDAEFSEELVTTVFGPLFNLFEDQKIEKYSEQIVLRAIMTIGTLIYHLNVNDYEISVAVLKSMACDGFFDVLQKNCGYSGDEKKLMLSEVSQEVLGFFGK